MMDSRSHPVPPDTRRALLAHLQTQIEGPDHRRAMDKGGYHVDEETPAAFMMRHGVSVTCAAAVVRERIAADAEDVMRGVRREWDFSSGYTPEGWDAARMALGADASEANVAERCVRLYFGLPPTPAPEAVASTLAKLRALLGQST